MTLEEMRSRMSLREYRLWAGLYEIDPWGEERADLRAGTIAAVVANCHSTRGSFKPSDFMPKFGQRYQPPQSPEEIRNAIVKMNAMFGGRVEKRK